MQDACLLREHMFSDLAVDEICTQLLNYEPTLSEKTARRRKKRTAVKPEMKNEGSVKKLATRGDDLSPVLRPIDDVSNRRVTESVPSLTASACAACAEPASCMEMASRFVDNGSTAPAVPELHDRDPDAVPLVAEEKEHEEELLGDQEEVEKEKERAGNEAEEQQQRELLVEQEEVEEVEEEQCECPETTPTGRQGSDLMAAKRERQTARRRRSCQREVPVLPETATAAAAGAAGDREWSRVLFLDVDGVLHSDAANSQLRYFSEPCMRRLKRVVDATGCELVLSSSWRLDPAKERLLGLKLAQYGLPPIQCKTRGGSDETARHELIAEWISSHRVGTWVAVDDLHTLTPQLGASHVVETLGSVGLTDWDAAALVAKLAAP